MDNSNINPRISKSNSAGGKSRFQRTFPKFIWIQLGGSTVICQGLGVLCFTSALQVYGADFVLWQVSCAELQLGSISHSWIWQNQVGSSTEYFSVAFRSKWAHKARRRSSCAVIVQECKKKRTAKCLEQNRPKVWFKSIENLFFYQIMTQVGAQVLFTPSKMHCFAATEIGSLSQALSELWGSWIRLCLHWVHLSKLLDLRTARAANL